MFFLFKAKIMAVMKIITVFLIPCNNVVDVDDYDDIITGLLVLSLFILLFFSCFMVHDVLM